MRKIFRKYSDEPVLVWFFFFCRKGEWWKEEITYLGLASASSGKETELEEGAAGR